MGLVPALQTLSLRPATGVYSSAVGFWRTRWVQRQVAYEDFCVDGDRVYPRLLGRRGIGRGHNVTTGLRPDDPQGGVESIQRLLGVGAPDFEDGRTSLYICTVCADLGCSTLSLRIVELEDRIAWTEIGWQVNYEDDFVPEPEVGPFAFARESYVRTLTTALRRYEELARR
jgi:hypothetical protein